jgi:CheY-like chemotaxis protein
MPTVLIIDDSPTQVACVRELLHGLQVMQRSSDFIERCTPLLGQVDMVLIALILVRQNGFECGLRLRELGFTNIVLYSDSPEDTDADWARAIGLQGLMQLPAPTQVLRQQVQSLFNASEQGGHDGKRWAS